MRLRERGRNLQKPPITKGMKYHVRLLSSWYVCAVVVAMNRTMNTAAAAKEGL